MPGTTSVSRVAAKYPLSGMMGRSFCSARRRWSCPSSGKLVDRLHRATEELNYVVKQLARKARDALQKLLDADSLKYRRWRVLESFAVERERTGTGTIFDCTIKVFQNPSPLATQPHAADQSLTQGAPCKTPLENFLT